MINLIGPEQKRDLRAARINVMLARYSFALVLLAILIGLIYGTGFWLVEKDKASVTAQLQSQASQSQSFAAVERQADSFRQNLAIAKSILDKETSYSTFLTTLASDVPSGAVLTGLSVGSPTQTVKKGLTINARANSYAKVLELKNNLEKSILFENVSIASTNRPDDISVLRGIEARYPYQAIFNVKLSAKATGNGATQ